MAWNYQKEFVVQIGQGTDSKFLTIRICKSMNDELLVRIRDEKTFELDEQKKYGIFLQMVQELEARNTKKGVNARPKRDQLAHIFNDVMQQMIVNEKDKNNDGAGYGVATHIMVEGMPNFYAKKYDYESSNKFKFESIVITGVGRCV